MESFKKIAEQTMNFIFDFVEKNYNSFDVDFEEENLKLQLDGNIFILSIHNPSSQIWLSSPISGAHHFKLIKENDYKSWTSTRDQKINLFDILESELKEIDER
tara:strand:+ start:301 stop:609 length:309 start_codon:yes stop_codon:yes gene_type:complete